MIPEGRIINSKYLYNGKELQTDFGLDWYDYGARFYDPALGRWHTVGPHAENYVGWSPYHYVANNPMLLTDPTGMDWYSYTDDDGNEHYKYQDGSDKSIDVDGNTYSNIGSSVSINLNDDVYLNAFQNLTMTSYGEAVDLKGKILNDNGMFHDYIKKGASIAYRWAATNTSHWLVYTESGSYAAAIGYSMLPEGSRGAVPGIPIRSSYQAVAEYWKNAVDLLFGKNKK